MPGKNNKIESKEAESNPVCEKCGSLMIEEELPGDSRDKEWVCPHCQGEIDFLGDEDE